MTKEEPILPAGRNPDNIVKEPCSVCHGIDGNGYGCVCPTRSDMEKSKQIEMMAREIYGEGNIDECDNMETAVIIAIRLFNAPNPIRPKDGFEVIMREHPSALNGYSRGYKNSNTKIEPISYKENEDESKN